MAIKDNVVSWYIKNYVIPRSQIFDVPGFIIFNISKTDVYSRQIILPESFFVNLEKEVINKFKKKGKQLLYSAGKKFGYRFALVANSSNITEMPKNKFLDYLTIMFKFIEGTYASKIEHKVDFSKTIITFHLKNFVICEKSGEGYFLTRGGCGGLCAKLFNNKNIESVQTACQGKGDKECVLVCAPPEFLKQYKNDLFIENKIEEKKLQLDNLYKEINKIQHINYSNHSFKDFLDSNTFSYKEGIIMRNNERYFIIEASVLYLIEMEFKKNSKTKKLLYDISYKTFLNILIEDKYSLQGIMDILASFGFGDVLILEKKRKIIININFFPWTKFYMNIDFIIIKGLLDGLLTNILKRKVKLKKLEKNLSKNNFSLCFSE